jgi:hypothetical protein
MLDYAMVDALAEKLLTAAHRGGHSMSGMSPIPPRLVAGMRKSP